MTMPFCLGSRIEGSLAARRRHARYCSEIISCEIALEKSRLCRIKVIAFATGEGKAEGQPRSALEIEHERSFCSSSIGSTNPGRP